MANNLLLLENKNKNNPTTSDALREHHRSEGASEAVQLAKSLEMSYRFNIAHAESAKPNYIRNAIKNDKIKDHEILAFLEHASLDDFELYITDRTSDQTRERMKRLLKGRTPSLNALVVLQSNKVPPVLWTPQEQSS